MTYSHRLNKLSSNEKWARLSKEDLLDITFDKIDETSSKLEKILIDNNLSISNSFYSNLHKLRQVWVEYCSKRNEWIKSNYSATKIKELHKPYKDELSTLYIRLLDIGLSIIERSML